MKTILRYLICCMMLSLAAAPVTWMSPVGVEAASAGWVKTSGKWKYRNSDGTYLKSCFSKINGKHYYFNKKGVMVTGLRKIEGSTYFFDENGARVSGWRKISGKWYFFKGNGKGVVNNWVDEYYYLGADGVMLKSCWKEIGGKKYFFQKDGKMRTGWKQVKSSGKWYYFAESGKQKGVLQTGLVTIDGEMHYFNSKGVMQTGWVKIKDKYYYFKSTGVMSKNTWINKTYYVGEDGARITDATIKIEGNMCTFDKDGLCTSRTEDVLPEKDDKTENTAKDDADVFTGKGSQTSSVNGRYYSDPQPGKISNEDLLTAVLYTEAGDQGDLGMQAVALTVLNRIQSTTFPGDLRRVVYQTSQFAVTSDGSLTRVLTNIAQGSSEYGAARKAARSAINIMKKYLSGESDVRNIAGFPDSRPDFDYLYFMSPASFAGFGLSAERSISVVYNGHIYFKNWSH